METEYKRKRSANFTEAEKYHLLNIIRNKYVNIIEDKKTDRASTYRKNLTWRKIEVEFNTVSTNNVYRSHDCLKKFYENKKKELKRHATDGKKQKVLTTDKLYKKEDTEEILMSILAEKATSSNTSKLDNDDISQDNDDNKIELEFVSEEHPVQKVENIEIEMETIDDLQQNSEPEALPENLWTPLKITESMLGTNLCTSASRTKRFLHPSRRRPARPRRTLTSQDISEKYSVLLDKRLELVEKQIQKLEEEQTFSREKQKLELELLRVEVAFKKQSLPLDSQI